MRLIKKRQHTVLSLPSLRLEGGLFLPDQLEKAALGTAHHQTEADYQTPKGLKLKDDYSRAFQIACAQWKQFALGLDRKDADAASVTTAFVQELLRDVLGYHTLPLQDGIAISDRRYPVTLMAGASVAVVVAPHYLGLDEADARFAIVGSGSRKKSAFQLAQEFLNASGDHLWALVSNGKQLRLLRDAATLTRPSYLEFDLQDLLDGQRFAEFAMAWRLLHASRAPSLPSPAGGRGTGGEGGGGGGGGGGGEGEAIGKATCIWEAWRSAGQEEGSRVRDGLRLGVTDALLTLGTGFIQHPANEALRLDLLEGRLSKEAYFQQLLRLIYRFIFLFTVEERGVLHTDDQSKAGIAARRAYAEGYALARLRDRCLRRRDRNQFDDLWSGLKIVFRGLVEGQPLLALPALGGLFAHTQCPHLEAAALSNAALMEVMKQLRWSNLSGNLAPVDYRNMGPEELGSVYESLLELVPEMDIHARTFGFVGLTSEGSTAGNARKTSGSYYTPDSLVQELIKSALDPVIEQRLAAQADNPIEALLAIRVIDPACGSGHFLLAAARRLAERLAALRATDGAVKPQDYRHALREVIARCIYGVDRNPMALELARTALWLEGFEEGKPLSFLDHHLQVGDALLGLTDLRVLGKGIAKDAFKPLSGDDKETCKVLAKANAAGLKQLERDLHRHQSLLQFDESTALNAYAALEALPAETPAEIAAKAAAYQVCLQEAKDSRFAHAATLLLGAFLLPKIGTTANDIPTSATLYLELMSDSRNEVHRQQLAAAQAACEHASVLHWPLTFPQVFAAGGFDCVLGNPPWERIKLQEEEFFATRHRDVALAKNKAERSQRIQWLSEGMLAQHLFPELGHSARECETEKRLFQEFISARRTAEAASTFMHINGEDGGRYPLTGVGDVNTYALFAETIQQITAPTGRAGFIVPTGIATDDSTKAFFGHIAQSGRLSSLFDFENREAIFPGVHRSYKFCLLTLGQAEQAEFAFFLTNTQQLADARRRFALSAEDFSRINPNTLTCPVFRSRRDAELTRKIYRDNVVLHADNKETPSWGIRLRTMFHKSADSELLLTSDDLRRLGATETEDISWNASNGTRYLRVYEGKYGWQFNHRYATHQNGNDVECDADWLAVPENLISTELYCSESAFSAKLDSMRLSDANHAAFLGFRRVSSSTNERTSVACIYPWLPSTYGWILTVGVHGWQMAALCAAYNSLVFDYLLRNALSQPSIPQGVFEQVAVPAIRKFDRSAQDFIVPRVLELTYTAHDLQPWAQDLGYTSAPFAFDPIRRAQLRAELDAWYAQAYGLTRDELRYILDPADVMGADYPSETFAVLKRNEERQYVEYRTQRLVLEAWDKLHHANQTN